MWCPSENLNRIVATNPDDVLLKGKAKLFLVLWVTKEVGVHPPPVWYRHGWYHTGAALYHIDIILYHTDIVLYHIDTTLSYVYWDSSQQKSWDMTYGSYHWCHDKANSECCNNARCITLQQEKFPIARTPLRVMSLLKWAVKGWLSFPALTHWQTRSISQMLICQPPSECCRPSLSTTEFRIRFSHPSSLCRRTGEHLLCHVFELQLSCWPPFLTGTDCVMWCAWAAHLQHHPHMNSNRWGSY